MKKIILFFSSAFGLGYIKYIPGTLGSLIGVIIWALFVPNIWIFQFFILVTIFLVSILFSSVAEKIYKRKDDQRIVIDEIAGIWFSVAFLPKTFTFLFLGFLLFRVLDIKKPCFIKKFQNVRGGIGVTIDDAMAGIFANVILHWLKYLMC